MRRLRWPNLVLLVGSSLCLASGVMWAEAGVLVVHVKDAQRHPIGGIQIGVEGDGGSAVTGDDGKARIRLAKQTKEKSWVSLQILKSPPGKDLVIVSPWEYTTLVPPFENESGNFVDVVVVQRGERTALENHTVLAALTARITKADAARASKSYSVTIAETLTSTESLTSSKDGFHPFKKQGEQAVEKEGPQEDPGASLAAVAKQYGLDPVDLDKAIRSWGEKTTDPYEAGLAALYERNYPRATTQLEDSLHIREEKLATDQKSVTADRIAVRDAAFFFAKALYGAGKYRESVAAFQRCLEIFPDDPTALNDTGVALACAGGYVEAEALFRRALVIYENALGPDHPYVAHALDNLSWVLATRSDYARAEPLSRRALAIDEKAFGPESPATATGLNNLARLMMEQGRYIEAEPLLRRALDIDEKAPAPSHLETAEILGNLAILLRAKGDYAGAEPLLRRALAIDEKTLGPDHPIVARDLSNLGELLQDKGLYTEAEPMLRRALEIDEKELGPIHPDTAIRLNNLGLLLWAKGDLAGAEPLYRRALDIDEKALGPDHPHMAICLNNLAWLLQAKGNFAAAEPLYRRALAIDEKALGPDHPSTTQIRGNLQALIDKESAKKAER
jgi:tetratricopeptide (TPR) repeat protein